MLSPSITAVIASAGPGMATYLVSTLVLAQEVALSLGLALAMAIAMATAIAIILASAFSTGIIILAFGLPYV